MGESADSTPTTTRRRFLLGASATTALALAGCTDALPNDGGTSANVAITPVPEVSNSGTALAAAAAAETALVATYDAYLGALAGAGSDPAAAPLLALAARARADHLAHQARLAAAAAAAGGVPPPPSPAATPAASPSVSDAVTALAKAEDAAALRYYALGAGLAQADLAQLCASIMAADSAHAAALALLKGAQPVPSPFVGQ